MADNGQSEKGHTIPNGLRVRSFNIPPHLVQEPVVGERAKKDIGVNPYGHFSIFVEDIPYTEKDAIGVKWDLVYMKPDEDMPEGQNVYVKYGVREKPGTTLKHLTTDKAFFGRSGVETVLEQVLHSVMSPETRQEFLKLVQSTDRPDKFLTINGHGSGEELAVGEAYGGGVPVDTLLTNLEEILASAGTACELRKKYFAIILKSCNTEKHEIPQEIVDRLGIPVFYRKNVVSIENAVNSPEHSDVIFPRKNGESENK